MEVNNLYLSVFNYGLEFQPNLKNKVHASLSRLQVLSGIKLNYPRLIELLGRVPKSETTNLIRLVFHIRNPRGGLGRRHFGRYAFQWLLINRRKAFAQFIPQIVEKGRWDDIFWLFPRALKLDNLSFVRRNYISKISDKELVEVRKEQKKVVEFVAENFLRNFNNYMNGKRYDYYFVKWLPNENSSLDRRFGIVATLCTHLNISLSDYRVIYVVPMRSQASIPEIKICKNQWEDLSFEEMGKGCLRKLRKTLSQKSETYKEWKKIHSRGYFIQPRILADSYLNEMTSGSPSRIENRELEWGKTLKLARGAFLGSSLVIIDTRGAMYEKSENYTFLATAIGVATVASIEKENYSYSFRHSQGFKRHTICDTMQNIVMGFRNSFSDYPSVREILEHAKNVFNDKGVLPRVVVFIGAKTCEIEKNLLSNWDLEQRPPKIILWNISSRKLRFRRIASDIDVVHIQGYTRDIYNYMMLYGDYDPDTTVSLITGTHSK